MRKLGAVAAVLVVLGGSAFGQAVDPKPAPAAPLAAMAPDPHWQPAPGDRPTVTRPDAPACANSAVYLAYMKAARAGDTVGMKEVADRSRGGVVTLAEGTAVLVIKPYRPRPAPPAPIPAGSTGQEVIQRQQDALTAPAPPEPDIPYPIEVRVLDGPHKDKAFFVAEPHLGMLRAVEPARPTPAAKKAAPPPTPEMRADALYRRGKALEAANPKAALEYYRRAAREFPATDAGRASARRADALAGQSSSLRKSK